MQQLFLPYRGFCARKGVLAKEMVLHDIDISNALVDFIQNNSISTMILGASSRSSLTRAFRNVDVPTSLCKIAPNFCSVYVISKGKVQSIRSASQPSIPGGAVSSKQPSQTLFSAATPVSEDLCHNSYRSWQSGGSSTMSFDKNNDLMQLTSCDKLSTSNSIVPSPQHSTSRMISSPQHPMCNLDLWFRSKGSSSNQDSAIDISDFSGPPSFQSTEMSCENLDYSLASDVSRTSGSSQTSNELEAEMRRLRDQLKQMMEMYNSVCKEAISSKEKAKEIDEWKPEEERKVLEAKQAQEAAMALAEMEKQKTKVAIEAALMAQRLAKYEIQMRKNAEMKAIHEVEERKKAMDALTCSEIRYRKYPIKEIEVATDYFSNSLKIGEGGYGPVYKAFLDHTPVAIKVLRPEMSQGKKQFQREVEVLSYIRHPNMVLLLGACPEYGCLVYEYMENGSLEDRLFRKNNSPPLPWKTRFRISAEVTAALLFLHRTKPEPLVNRDLKPATILLNRNYVSKINDVGLARYRTKILPMGSYPRIMDSSNNTYELFGPVNLFWSTRYDKATTLFLTCLKDFAEFANSKDKENNIPAEKCFKLPYKIENDRVENYSITESFNRQENWTKALKYTLCNLKWALYWFVGNSNFQPLSTTISSHDVPAAGSFYSKRTGDSKSESQNLSNQ